MARMDTPGARFKRVSRVSHKVLKDVGWVGERTGLAVQCSMARMDTPGARVRRVSHAVWKDGPWCEREGMARLELYGMDGA